MRSETTQPASGQITLRSLLLLFTGGLVLLLLIISVSVSFDRFRDYMVHELEGHTRDAATAVGLSLSNAIDARDPVAVASLLDAVFDSGDYLVVEFLNHQGERIAGRRQSLADTAAPDWFVAAASLPRPEGVADVMQGWQWLGFVRVVGHPGRAYEDLWRITLRLTLSAVLVGAFALLALYLLLGRLLAPLQALARHAAAVSRRNFRHRLRVRSTRELNQVTAAMNQMTDDLEQLFEGQARLIHHLRKLNNEDALTGLASRNAFDQRLRVEVESEENRVPGVLILVQIGGFADFNQSVGRLQADGLLVRSADSIREFLARHNGAFAGRRSGAEFALFLPGASLDDGLIWGAELVSGLQSLCQESDVDHGGLAVHGGIAAQAGTGSVRQLFETADESLRRAQASSATGCSGGNASDGRHHGGDRWRELIGGALARRDIWLWQQPLMSADDTTVVAWQMFSRLMIEREWVRGNVFAPLAERYGLIGELDLLVLEQVLERLGQDPERVISISLGLSSFSRAGFVSDVLARAEAAGPLVQRLWVGVAEQSLVHHRKEVQSLMRGLRKAGVKLMIDRFGVGGVPFSYLRNLPVQALRMDHSFISGIDRQEDNRFYLESMVAIAHGRGVRVFAAGVETDSEWRALKASRIDGGLGYHLGRPGPAGEPAAG